MGHENLQRTGTFPSRVEIIFAVLFAGFLRVDVEPLGRSADVLFFFYLIGSNVCLTEHTASHPGDCISQNRDTIFIIFF